MDYLRLSKTLAYILRHHPENFDITLDKDGFAELDDLVTAINNKKKFDTDITEDDLVYVEKHDEKQRFQIVGDKMRALYGHTNGIETIKEPSEPPEFLFHGTSQKAAEEIKKHGLKSMSRVFVHLSTDIETAIAVGKRRDDNPVVFKILAKKAFENGTLFYKATDKIWLCKDLRSSAFIEQTEFIMFTERTVEDVYKIKCITPTRVMRDYISVYNGKKLLSENAICVYPLLDEDRIRFFNITQRYAEVYKIKNYIRVKLFPDDKNGNYLHIDFIDVENKTANALPSLRFCDNANEIKGEFINVITEHSRYIGHIPFLSLGAFRSKHPEIDEILKTNE